MIRVLVTLVGITVLGGCSKEEKLPEIDEARKQQLATARKLNSKATDAQTNQFIEKMKDAVKARDVQAFARLLHYPCTLHEGKQHAVLKDEAEFLPHAPYVMEAVRGVVLKARIDDIFVNYLGFMLGNGEIWFDPLQGIASFKVPARPEGSSILNSLLGARQPCPSHGIV